MSKYARQKMTEASRVFHAWEGTYEQPRNSNRIFVWTMTKPEWNGSPYCAATNVAAYLKVGIDLRKLVTNPYYVPNLENIAKRNGWFKTSGGREGDLVIFGADSSIAYHTGVSQPRSGSLYYGHEGNTSPGSSGSQDNGGGIFHRGRSRSWIRGWVDMEKVIDYMIKAKLHFPPADSSAPKPPSKAPTLLAVDGELGPKTYKVLSRYSGQSAKQANGTWTKNDVKYLQRKLKVSVDGIWGPQTSRALQRVVKTRVDGIFGRNSIKALQRYLNRGILAGRYKL